MNPDEPSRREVKVVAAKLHHEPTLARLLELYANDFRKFHAIEVEPDSRFVYKQLQLYWIEPTRFPFLIEVGGREAGFALVKRGSAVSTDFEVWDMAEFFVLQELRRHGIGREAAAQLWRVFPGSWEVRVMAANMAATQFWSYAITTFIDGPVCPSHYEQSGVLWQLFAFESR